MILIIENYFSITWYQRRVKVTFMFYSFSFEKSLCFFVMFFFLLSRSSNESDEEGLEVLGLTPYRPAHFGMFFCKWF